MSKVKRFKPVINSTPYKPYAYCEENEDGIYVRIDDYEALQAQRDALAAENAALSRYFSASAGAVEHWNSWANAEDKLASVPKTPATDAFINSVRADELGKVAALINMSAGKRQLKGYDDCVRDRRNLAAHFLNMAHQLRAGEPS